MRLRLTGPFGNNSKPIGSNCFGRGLALLGLAGARLRGPPESASRRGRGIKLVSVTP